MKNYERPVILVNEELSEGVYAASGARSIPGCDSKYMNGIFQEYAGGWNVTAKEFYGCVGCPAYRNSNGLVGCALLVDKAYLDGATSYDTDAGNRMPDWERMGALPDRMINDENGLLY